MKKILIMVLFLVTSALPTLAKAAVDYTDGEGTPVYTLSAGVLKAQVSAETGTAVTAVYDQQKLVGLDVSKIVNQSAVNEVYVDSADYTVKTFLLHNLLNLKPIGEPDILTKDSYKLVQYAVVPNAVESAVYEVKVNGEDIFTEDYKDISYARFAIGGYAEVEVTAANTITSYDISPHSQNIKAVSKGKSLTFPVTSGQKLIVTLNGGRKLFIFADAPEVNPPKVGDEGVYSLAAYNNIDNTGNSVITQAFQSAVNDIAGRPEGGILYVPNGIYKMGTVKIYSNVSVYLESGALIQGTSNKADYKTPITTKDGNDVLISALICFDTAQNARIYGRGTIDGDGLNLRKPETSDGRDAWLISLIECKNVSVEDVILRDPAAFNSHIQYSDHIVFDGVKLINDITNPNTDGIDPDSSRDVLIQNTFMYCSDDTISVKTHRYSTLVRNAYDITVRNNVLWTKKSALKIGDETSAHRVHDVLFENNDVIHADRAMTIYVYDGATVSNISFVNNRAQYIGGDFFERHIDFWIRTRDESCLTPGRIENIIIKDFYAENPSKNNSSILGFDAGHMAKNIYIDNYVVNGVKKNSLSEAKINVGAYAGQVIFTTAPVLEPISEEKPIYDGNSAFVQNGRYIAVEAEDYIRNTDGSKASWRKANETEKRGAVGGTSMIAQGAGYVNFGTEISGSPRLDYKVKFSEAGTYYLWTRMYGTPGMRNTLHAGVDGIQKPVLNSLSHLANGGWFWNNKNKSATYAVIEISEPGEHIINIWAGATHLYFDRFILLQANSGEELIQYMSTGKKGMGYPQCNTEQ